MAGLTEDIQGLARRLVEPLRAWFVGGPPEDWHAATLLNGWSDYGGIFAPAGYYKDGLGVVHIRGLIAGGTTTASTVLFTLPAGYCPPYSLHIWANNVDTIVPMRIEASGNVFSTAALNNTWMSLDLPPFRAA